LVDLDDGAVMMVVVAAFAHDNDTAEIPALTAYA
jgi:hypothetical protein